LYAFKINEKTMAVEQIVVVDSTLDGPPCCLAVDYNNCLWVIQEFKEQPLLVLEVSEEGGSYTVCLSNVLGKQLVLFILDSSVLEAYCSF
jgi:hypothetical protein